MQELTTDERGAILTAAATEIRGEANARHSNAKESRYGRRGSLSIDLNKGAWYDHQEGEGGESPVGLVMHLLSLDKAGAYAWLGQRHERFRNDEAFRRIGSATNIYRYRSREGVATKRVIRQNNGTGKRIWQEPAEEGMQLSDTPKTVYRYQSIQEGIENGEPIIIVEGEKCADYLWNRGFYATTNDQGAGKWTREHSRCLSGARDVVIIPDNDLPGAKHAESVADALAEVAITAYVLRLENLPPKGDVVDWFETEGTVETLETLIRDIIRPHLPPSLSEFAALPFPPMDRVLGPFTTQQINLLFAPSGAGKTMLGLSIAYAIAEHRSFIGWEPGATPLRVLYVDAEMAARMVQERFGAARSDNLYIANLHGWGASIGLSPVNIATEHGQTIVSSWIRDLEIDVIFLDNFMTMAWRDGVSFSSDEIWTPVRRWCLDLRGQGKTVFIVDHANAQGQVFGTKTKTHQVDLTAVLEPVRSEDAAAFETLDPGDSQSTQAVLRFEKKRGYADGDSRVAPKQVVIGPVDSDWEHRKPVDPFLAEITSLRDNGLSLREIARELEVPYSKVQRTWRNVQTNPGE